MLLTPQQARWLRNSALAAAFLVLYAALAGVFQESAGPRGAPEPVAVWLWAPAPAPPPHRRHSAIPGCEAASGADVVERAVPCGRLASRCVDLPVVAANKDYPGGGRAGALEFDQDYVVQFDVGLHPAVAQSVLSTGPLNSTLHEIDSCVGCPENGQSFVEECLEVVVRGGAMWGDLDLEGVATPGAYDCMGSCGPGCAARRGTSIRKGWLRPGSKAGALDCLKHDVCSAWKTRKTRRQAEGFCHDPDCGDEAAMSLYNCWRGWRLIGSIGSSNPGLFSEPAVCDPEDGTVQGCWSHGGWFTKGDCKVFQGWERGQGIPDPVSPWRAPLQHF